MTVPSDQIITRFTRSVSDRLFLLILSLFPLTVKVIHIVTLLLMVRILVFEVTGLGKSFRQVTDDARGGSGRRLSTDSTVTTSSMPTVVAIFVGAAADISVVDVS